MLVETIAIYSVLKDRPDNVVVLISISMEGILTLKTFSEFSSEAVSAKEEVSRQDVDTIEDKPLTTITTISRDSKLILLPCCSNYCLSLS